MRNEVDKEEKASTNEAQEDNKPEATTAEDNTSDCPRPVEPPAPPRRFRTAFIFFSAARHKEIRDDPRYGEEEPTVGLAKRVAAEWRELPLDDRKVWQERAREDRKRYDREMEEYMAATKDLPDSVLNMPEVDTSDESKMPKRPMSAYLAFSNKRRGEFKQKHPDASNAELSRMLSKAWKEASDDIRDEYISQERRCREQYNRVMIPWRKRRKHSKKSSRKKKKESEDVREAASVALNMSQNTLQQMRLQQPDVGVAPSNPISEDLALLRLRQLRQERLLLVQRNASLLQGSAGLNTLGGLGGGLVGGLGGDAGLDLQSPLGLGSVLGQSRNYGGLGSGLGLDSSVRGLPSLSSTIGLSQRSLLEERAALLRAQSGSLTGLGYRNDDLLLARRYDSLQANVRRLEAERELLERRLLLERAALANRHNQHSERSQGSGSSDSFQRHL